MSNPSSPIPNPLAGNVDTSSQEAQYLLQNQDTQNAISNLEDVLQSGNSQDPNYINAVFVALMGTVETLGAQGQTWSEWVQISNNSSQATDMLLSSLNQIDMPANANPAEMGEIQIENQRVQAQASIGQSNQATEQTVTQTDTTQVGGVAQSEANTLQEATTLLQAILQIMNLNRF